MPKLRKSGDVFRLGADGSFDSIWLTSGKVGANVGISYDGGVEFCHGLDASIGIEAAADISGALTVFMPSVRAEGHAFAAAEAGITAQLSPNVFDKVGLSVDARAFAQASVAGRISIGLDFTEIAQIAENALDDLSYKMFIAFLNEITLEAGVWGRVGFAAMAEAHLEVNGTVLGEESGFQISAGAGAGLGGGTAWDFFCKAGIEDPRRLYTTITELLIAELAAHARREMEPEYGAVIEVFEFVAPIAATTAYDLGEVASEQLLQPANQSVAPFLEAFSQRLAFYILDKVVDLGVQLLSRTLIEAVSALTQRQISDADRQAIDGHLRAAIDMLSSGPLELDTAVEVLTPIADALTLLAPDLVEQWESELAILWSAAAAGRSLRRSAAKAGVTLNVLGLGASSFSGSALTVPTPPLPVRRAYERHFGLTNPAIGFDDVIDFLTDQSLGPLLERHVPLVEETLGQVGEVLGITLGDVVEAALTGAVGEDLSNTDLYVQLRDYCKNAIEFVVMDDLIDPMKEAVADTPDAVTYIDEVVVPVLQGTSHFAFGRVDELVAGLSASDFDAFSPSFKEGLADLVWLLFSRNVVFLADVMLDKAIVHLNDGFTDLQTRVRDDDAMISDALSLGEDVFPGFVSVDPDHADALRDLVIDLLGAGAHAFGPAIWDHTRRTNLKRLIKRLLDRGAAADYSNHPEVNRALNELAECYGIKDAAGLVLVIKALAELTADEFEVVVERVIPALEIFFLRLSAKPLQEIETRVINFIGVAADHLREIERALAELEEALEELAQDIAELGGDAAAALSAVAAELASARWRDAVLNALEIRAMNSAEATLRASIGFDLQPPSWQATEIAAARGAASIAFGAVRLLLDPVLHLSGGVIAVVAETVDVTSSVPLAAANLADALKQKMLDQLAAAGIVLPPDLSVTDIEAEILAAINALALQDLIEAYVVARRAELDATAERDREEDVAAQLRADAIAARAAQNALVGTRPEIEIVSPAPINPDHGFVYTREVPVHAVISGAKPAYLEPGSPTRTMVRMNGVDIDLPDAAWSFDDASRSLVLSGLMTTGLKDGLNTLEVSVADGVSDPVRATVSFMCDPSLEPRGGDLRVAGELSQFDAPGNDHQSAKQEYVTLQNTGTETIELEGLRVADRVGHVYVFGKKSLASGAAVRVRTGKGRDGVADVHWGRAAAVWNNRGDTVYVYDKDHVLWTEYSY
ncbi:lamin tail domain-containing protein [uncultured Tateyamaria sp.]|uniref:lamin tail domain-containing protein n=1 Tax=Tateyamaria sp. 1078 TaxID=3417464 RepID=UPI0026259610|nr:lamin tail domain-containing protein [uncultured Tateyamaria sp.]